MAATNTPPVGRKADKKIRDALLAALREDPTRLKRAAEKVWQMAVDGDISAFREIADRIDGKVAQAIVGGDENDSPVAHNLVVSFVAVKKDGVFQIEAPHHVD